MSRNQLMCQHNEHPWRRTNGHHYVTTEPFTRDGVTYPAGFPFQVSIPPAFHRLPVVRTIIHDLGWLIRARNHDADLKAEPKRVRTAIRAAWRFLVDDPGPPTKHRWAILLGFVAILIVTVSTRLARRVLSWRKS